MFILFILNFILFILFLDSNDSPPAGKMTIGELLKYKASQGVRVLLHVWDEALSVNIAGFTTAGVMATFDEETKVFKNINILFFFYFLDLLKIDI